jgi:geranylgeranyl diphosphate synthase type II
VALGETDEETRSAFSAYGEHLGMAFQIVDDILDVTWKKSEMGKTPGKDSEQGKITFVAAYGLQQASQLAARETSMASRAISRVNGNTDLLASLPGTLLDRSI